MAVGRYSGRGLHGQTVHELGSRVVNGTWAPGETIVPEALEAELGVSKTVVREALRVLGAKGLVDSRPKRGTYVRPRADWNLLDSDVMQWQLDGPASDRFFAELAELRAVLEPAWARLAAIRRTDQDLEQLDAALEAMAQAEAESDANKAITADLAFHKVLLAAAHNELMLSTDVVITNALDARDRLVHQKGDQWGDPTPLHAALVARIRASDPEGSAAAALLLLARAEQDVQHARAGAAPGRVAPSKQVDGDPAPTPDPVPGAEGRSGAAARPAAARTAK